MLTRSKGRPVRDHAEAQSLLSSWQESGESMSDWCRARGINWRSLRSHKARIAKAQAQAVSMDFIEVTLASAGATPNSRYELHLGDGRHIVITDDFSPQTLSRILTVCRSC